MLRQVFNIQSYDSICEYLASDFLTYSLGLTSSILVEKQNFFYFFSKDYLIRIDNPYNYFCKVKSVRMNFCPGDLILKLLARIGECYQNLSEKTV